MSFSSIYSAILVIPKLNHVEVDGKVLEFKAGLNLLVIDSGVDEEGLLKILGKGKEHLLLDTLDSGTSLVLLIGGIGVVHRSPDDCLLVTGIHQLLDDKNFDITIKLLSKSRHQVVAVVRNTRKLPRVKVEVER